MIYMKDSCPVYDPRNKRYKSMFEFMFVFSKGTPNTYNELKDKPTKRARVVSGATHWQPNGTKRNFRDIEIGDFQARGNIWLYAIGNGKVATDKISNEHPARFPEALAQDHILSWSNEGDTILDCFTGSGTTLKMAKMLNRHYLGIEISPEYVALAEKRLLATPVPLFGQGRGLTLPAPDGGDSAPSQALSTPDMFSAIEHEPTPAPRR